MSNKRKTICYLATSAGDWGGASRVLYTTLKMLDQSRYRPLVLLPSKGPVLDTLNEWGISYQIWGDLGEPRGRFDYLRNLARAFQFLIFNKVDVLHSHHSNFWRPAIVLAAKILRIPILTHAHLVISTPGPFLRHVTLILAVSEYVAKNTQPFSVPRKVIYNSVDMERYDLAEDLRAELGISPDQIVVSFIGQIREIKGIDLFLQLARRIPDDNVIFLIVGECRDPARFKGAYTVERLTAEIGDDQRIRYVGYRTDVENLYRTSDIIIVPSRWEEPFGLINIEAGAAHKPVIATRVGGIPEAIIHEKNGLLVEKDDLEGLVAATERLIRDRTLRLALGENGRRLVEESYSSRPIRELEQVYEEVLKDTGQS